MLRILENYAKKRSFSGIFDEFLISGQNIYLKIT